MTMAIELLKKGIYVNNLMKNKRLNKHIHKFELEKIAKILFAVVVLVTMLFLLYIALFEKIDIYQARKHTGYEVIQHPSSKKIIDKDKPLGMYTQYSWTQKKVLEGQNCLAFYVVHQYVEVYFDGKLMYSLKPNEKNRIGRTSANNWVLVPIYSEDEGKEIVINIIPSYKAVSSRDIKFCIGSKFMIYFDQLKQDLPQIVLSLLAIGVGVIFIIISIFHKYKGKENSTLIYLGMFSSSIGIWKITDVRFAPLMFSNNTLVLSYISITMIMLGVIPWILSIRKQFSYKMYNALDYSCIICSIVALVIILLQITNVFDLRPILWIVHILIGVVVLMIVGTCIYERKQLMVDNKSKGLYICVLLCILGLSIDIATYYIQGTSSRVLYTLSAFLIYVITVGCISINEINHKANIDVHTGLLNKSRCNEMLDSNEVIQESLGVIMFDLNKLKQTNDTFGHESGDLLIAEFAKILRYVIGRRQFVGRYGGDEFIAVIKNADEQKMRMILSDIERSVDQYNLKNTKINMSYACGYVLSDEYPEASLRELLKEADDKMYKDKKANRDKDL